MAHTLLLKNIRHLVTVDSGDSVLANVNLHATDGVIDHIGLDAPPADVTLDLRGMAAYPGLINTHHHLYQILTRNIRRVQNLELFDWLVTLYEIWKHLTADGVRMSSLTGMGELAK